MLLGARRGEPRTARGGWWEGMAAEWRRRCLYTPARYIIAWQLCVSWILDYPWIRLRHTGAGRRSDRSKRPLGPPVSVCARLNYFQILHNIHPSLPFFFLSPFLSSLNRCRNCRIVWLLLPVLQLLRKWQFYWHVSRTKNSRVASLCRHHLNSIECVRFIVQNLAHLNFNVVQINIFL